MRENERRIPARDSAIMQQQDIDRQIVGLSTHPVRPRSRRRKRREREEETCNPSMMHKIITKSRQFNMTRTILIFFVINSAINLNLSDGVSAADAKANEINSSESTTNLKLNKPEVVSGSTTRRPLDEEQATSGELQSSPVDSTTTSSFDQLLNDDLPATKYSALLSASSSSPENDYMLAGQEPTQAPSGVHENDRDPDSTEASQTKATSGRGEQASGGFATTPTVGLLVTSAAANEQTDHSSMSPIEATSDDEETTTMLSTVSTYAPPVASGSPEPLQQLPKPRASSADTTASQHPRPSSHDGSLVRSRKSPENGASMGQPGNDARHTTDSSVNVATSQAPSGQPESTTAATAADASNRSTESAGNKSANNDQTAATGEQQGFGSAQLDYDDFDLDYQLKLNTSGDQTAASSLNHNKRDYDNISTKAPNWSTLIRQPHVFTPSNQSSSAVSYQPSTTHVRQVAQGPMLPSLLTVKSTQLTSQEMEKVKPQFLLYQDTYDSANSFSAEQMQAFANGDLLATASQSGGAGPQLSRVPASNSTSDQQVDEHSSNTRQSPDLDTIAQSSSDLMRPAGGKSRSGSRAPTPSDSINESATTESAAVGSGGKGQSQANQWFNYPHPNLHHNPLLLHHILNKPTLYAQHVGAIQQQSQSPSATSLLKDSPQATTNGPTMATSTTTQSSVMTSSTSAASNMLNIIERPTVGTTEANLASPINRTQLDMQLDEMRAIAAAASQQQKQQQQGGWNHNLNQQQKSTAASNLLQQQVRQPQIYRLPQVKSGADPANPIVQQQHPVPLLVQTKSSAKFSPPVQLFSQAEPKHPPAVVGKLYPIPSPVQAWLPAASKQAPPSPLSFNLIKPALASQIVAAPSFLQEVYARPASYQQQQANISASLSQEAYELLKQLRASNQSQAIKQSALSDEDMSTYVAQLASFRGGADVTGSSWLPASNIQDQATDSHRQLAANNTTSDLDMLIQRLLIDATNQQQLNQNTSAHQVQWAEPPPQLVASKQQAEDGTGLTLLQQIQQLQQQQQPIGSMTSSSQHSTTTSGNKLGHPNMVASLAGHRQPLNPAAGELNQNYYSIEGHQRQQKKDREQLEALLNLKHQRQLAFIEAIKANLAKATNQHDSELAASINAANGTAAASTLFEDVVSLTNADANATSPAVTAAAALHLAGDEFDEQTMTNKPIPDWLERQIIQESLIHESNRMSPLLAQAATRNLLLAGRNPYLAPLGLTGRPLAPMRTPSAAQLHAAQLAAAATLAAASARLPPPPTHQWPLNIRPMPAAPGMSQVQASANQVPMRIYPLVAPTQLQQQQQHPGSPMMAGESTAAPQIASSSNTINLNALSPATRLLADRFPLASAPAYLVKLPTLTGGTITAAGSFLPPGSSSSIRLHRPRPVPLRLLSAAAASIAPTRLKLMTHNMLQQSPSAARPMHQVPPAHYFPFAAYPPGAHHLTPSSAYLPPTSQLLQAGSSFIPLSPPPPSGSQPPVSPVLPTLHHHHHYRLISPQFAANLQQDGLQSSANGLQSTFSQATGMPQLYSSTSSSNSTRNQPTTTSNGQPSAESPSSQQQQQPPLQLLQQSPSATDSAQMYPSSSSQDQSSGQQSSDSPSSGVTATVNSQSPAATLNRLQQATASLVELTSIASLVEELAGGSGIDPSPALALANAITALSTAHQAHQQTLNTQASTYSSHQAPSDASGGNALQVQQPLVMNTPFSLKTLLAWRDRQLAKGRDLGAFERLLVNTARRPPVARLRVKYIRVPVAVYENSLTGDTGALIVPPRHQLMTKTQLAELVANAAAQSAGSGNSAPGGGSTSAGLNTAASAGGDSSVSLTNSRPTSSMSSATSGSSLSSSGSSSSASSSDATNSANAQQSSSATGGSSASGGSSTSNLQPQQQQPSGGSSASSAMAAPSSTDYLFDELSSDPSIPQLALALRELAHQRHRQQLQMEDVLAAAAASEPVPRYELLPVTSLAANHQYRQHHSRPRASIKRLVPVPVTSEQQQQLTSPLESAMYMSMVASPSGLTPAIVDAPAKVTTQGKPSNSGHLKPHATTSGARGKKAKSGAGKKGRKYNPLKENQEEIQPSKEQQALADDLDDGDSDDDSLTNKELSIIESIISTIIHGPQQSPSTSAQLPSALPGQADGPLTLLPFGPLVTAGSSPVPALAALGGGSSGGWRSRSPFGGLRAESSSSVESYAPPASHRPALIRAPFGKQSHRFSLGEVVGALGARKLITSLLSKRKRSRTSKRTVQQAAAAAASSNNHKVVKQYPHRTLFTRPSGSTLTSKRHPTTSHHTDRLRPSASEKKRLFATRLVHLANQQQADELTVAATGEGGEASGEQYKTTPPSITIWYPTSADHELTTAPSLTRHRGTTKHPFGRHHSTTPASFADLLKPLISSAEIQNSLKMPTSQDRNTMVALTMPAGDQHTNRRKQMMMTTTTTTTTSPFNETRQATTTNRPPVAGGAPYNRFQQSSVQVLRHNHLSPRRGQVDAKMADDAPVELEIFLKANGTAASDESANKSQSGGAQVNGGRKKEDIMAMPLYHVVADHYSKLHMGATSPKTNIDHHKSASSRD